MKHNLDLINETGELILGQKATVAVAESVTSGNIQAAFSLARNAIYFFQGGITTYNIGQKCRHLLVEPTHAIASNCVSALVAEQMAVEVCNLFKSDYGIGITGYASPVPEKNIRHLFAFVAIAKCGKIIKSEKITSPNSATVEVQEDFTSGAIRLLFEVLKKGKKEF